MKKSSRKKGLVLTILILFLGASMTSPIGESLNKKKSERSYFYEPIPTDVTIIDWVEDVISFDEYNNITIVTNSTDIKIEDIDITQATCTQQGQDVTLSLQVRGTIENRGTTDFYNITEIFDLVEYDFQLITSEQEYLIGYVNQTGLLEYDNKTINLTYSDFSVMDDTLSITFSLVSADEIYQDLSVDAVYFKINFSSPEFIFFFDMAPNPPLFKAFFIGLIENPTITPDYIIFNPLRMTAIWFLPFNITRNTSGPFMISTKYFGYVGHWIIIGVFNVDMFFLGGNFRCPIKDRLLTYLQHKP
jgi:hypothetical protein